MVEVTVLSRQGCHLCEVALATVKLVQLAEPFALREQDVAADPGLEARYGSRIPVILIDGVEAFAGRVSAGDLRRAIKRARWRRPVSRILSRLGWMPTRG